MNDDQRFPGGYGFISESGPEAVVNLRRDGTCLLLLRGAREAFDAGLSEQLNGVVISGITRELARAIAAVLNKAVDEGDHWGGTS
jgi:hypothetical protein